MKKYKKKRIVRRKRRISEREIMRIKRKLKKSARKLRLGAKRTGAYVYGTLRRIVGNPGGRYRVGGGYKTFTLDEAKREAERIFRATGNIVSIEEHRPTPQVAPAWKYGIYTGRGVVRKNARKPRASDLARWRAEARVRDDKSRGVFWTTTKDYLSGPKYDPARWDSRGAPVNVPDWYRASLKKNPNDYSIRDIKSGDRIQLHPGHDMWMRGARFGTVVGVGQKLIAVKLDGVRKYVKILPRHVGEIYPNRRLRGNPAKNYYSELLRAGIPMDHHESDLYVMDTPEARRILSDWPFGRLERFRSNINGKIYIDVPFGYMPYWERKMRR